MLAGVRYGAVADSVRMYLAYVPALSILFTWLHGRTAGSLLLVTLFHAALQAWNVLLPVLPGEEGDTRPYVLAVMLTMLLASLMTGRCCTDLTGGARSCAGVAGRPLTSGATHEAFFMNRLVLEATYWKL